jgi:hypothetical protein
VPIPKQIVQGIRPSRASSRQVEREFRRRLAEGARIEAAGSARKRPLRLLTAGYTPKHRVRLFDTHFYLSNVRRNEHVRFFVGYVVRDGISGRGQEIFPRIFYKDVSLVWRAASHYFRSDREDFTWIGKGELRYLEENGVELEASDESTTDLPLEVQTAFESLSRRATRVPYDVAAIDLVLRRAPLDRIDAYRDFNDPRRRARADPRNLVNRGRSVARFTRKNDPTSLRFVKGFEPDFDAVLETVASTSKLYGGELRRFRILSRNRKIQYLFFAGPRHVWIIPPQATTTQLTSYGLRSIDVIADEDLCIPGYEYHFLDESEDPPVFHSQIPEGYAGAVSEVDDSRADASAWLDQLPVVQEFRRKLLGQGRAPRGKARAASA